MAHWSGIGIPKTNAIALEVSYTHKGKGKKMKKMIMTKTTMKNLRITRALVLLTSNL